ncbi:MAG: M28 family peptidase [Ardenticatenia bacterium]|nr:M28 family peptidase [Ardenticatenia bacterium]
MTVIRAFEKEIIGEAWTSEVYANVETLCDFGSRFAGTESESLARSFIHSKLIEYGLAEVRLATFDYLAWERGEASLTTGGAQPRILSSAQSLVYSPSTAPGGVRGEALWLGMGSKADFSAKAGEIAGRFVAVSTDSPAGERCIHRREKYGRAVAAGAIGFIFVNHLPGMLAPTGSLRPGQLADIPAVGLSSEDGFTLQRLLGNGEPLELEMRLSNGTRPAQFSHVIGEAPGLQRDAIVVVGAHYDGHDISQGAVDDASGTALVMELARIFAPLAGKLRRTLRFETYAAEELGVLGSTLYVNAMSDRELEAVDFMLNLDGAALRSGRGLALQGIEELRPLFASFARETGYPLELNNRVGTASDHFPYWMRGVPAASVFARPPAGQGRGFGHTKADTLDKVSEAELRESAMVAARLLLRLADHPEAIGRKRSPEALRAILLEQDLEEPLRAQDKWPFD